jgi:hypothetical protein
LYQRRRGAFLELRALVTSNCLDKTEALKKGADRNMRFAPLSYPGLGG